MKSLESKGNTITEEIITLKQQIDKTEIDIKKFNIHNITSAQALRWITERLIYSGQLKKTLKNLEFRTLSKEQCVLLRSLNTKLEDIVNLLKGYEKSNLIDKNIERTLTQLSKSRQSSKGTYTGKKKDIDNTNTSYTSYESNKNHNEEPKTYRESKKGVALHTKGSYSMMGDYIIRSQSNLKTKRNSYSSIGGVDTSLSLSSEKQITQMDTFSLSQELGKERRLNKIITSEFNKLKTEYELFMGKFNEQEEVLRNINKEFKVNEEMLKRLSDDNITLNKQYEELFTNYNLMKSQSEYDNSKLNKYKARTNEQEKEIHNLNEKITVLKQEMVYHNVSLEQSVNNTINPITRKLSKTN